MLDWIPEYLQESTKNVLREEMQKEASAADTPGYIYAYEIEGMQLLLLCRQPCSRCARV